MKNIYKYIVFVILLPITGCSKHNIIDSNIDNIRINPSSISDSSYLSEIVDSVYCIKLETTDESAMSNPIDLVIRDKYIYVLTRNPNYIYLFDKRGNYISKLDKIGRGRGEYLALGSFYIDENEEYIDVYDRAGAGGSLLRYKNVTFEYIGKKDIPVLLLNSSLRIGNTIYAYTQQLDNIINGESCSPSLVIMENEKINQVHLMNKKIKDRNGSSAYFHPFPQAFAHNQNGELFLSIMYDNYIYKVEGSNISPIFNIAFDKHGIDNSKLKNMNSIKQLEEIKSAKDRAMFPHLNYSDSLLTIISYYYKTDKKSLYGDVRSYIKLNNKDKTIHSKKLINDISNFPLAIDFSQNHPIGHQNRYKNYFIDVVMPEHIVKDEGITYDESLGEINMYDNPIISSAK